VSYYDTQAVSYLLRGVDPYGATYTVPAALATAGASMVFAYPPGLFAFIAPAGAVRDPRLGLVLADLVVALSLLIIRGGRRRVLSSVYLLFPPTILFSVWFLNNALPSMAFLAVAVLLESRGRPTAASVLWGLAVAASQEVWLLFPLYAYHSVRKHRYTEVLVALAVALALVAPFFLWNSPRFVYDTVFFQFTRAAVGLISSGPFGLNVNPSLQGFLVSLGTSAPLVARGALAVLAMLLALRWVRGTLSSLMLASTFFCTMGLFLLAGELFWNYLELPFMTLLAWVALRGTEHQQVSPDAFKA